MFENIINSEISLINQKIKGTSFLEILKFNILKNLSDKSEKINFNDKTVLLSDFKYEDEQKIINANIKVYQSPKVILNGNEDKNLLIICLNESIRIDIQDKQTNKFISMNILPYSGITISKNTNFKLNFIKNTIILEIKHIDKNLGIENQNDTTI